MNTGKTKVVKAWAVVAKEEPSMNWHDNRPMIYGSRSDANFHKYQGDLVVPCEIQYKIKK